MISIGRSKDFTYVLPQYFDFVYVVLLRCTVLVHLSVWCVFDLINYYLSIYFISLYSIDRYLET